MKTMKTMKTKFMLFIFNMFGKTYTIFNAKNDILKTLNSNSKISFGMSRSNKIYTYAFVYFLLNKVGYNKIYFQPGSPFDIEVLCSQLKKEGHIMYTSDYIDGECDMSESQFIQLTEKGLYFIEHGGYKVSWVKSYLLRFKKESLSLSV
jgi:hypothetical protein